MITPPSPTATIKTACTACKKTVTKMEQRVVCDGCSAVYHFMCSNEAKVPREAWYCSTCAPKHNVAGRGKRVRNPVQLYDAIAEDKRKEAMLAKLRASKPSRQVEAGDDDVVDEDKRSNYDDDDDDDDTTKAGRDATRMRRRREEEERKEREDVLRPRKEIVVRFENRWKKSTDNNKKCSVCGRSGETTEHSSSLKGPLGKKTTNQNKRRRTSALPDKHEENDDDDDDDDDDGSEEEDKRSPNPLLRCHKCHLECVHVKCLASTATGDDEFTAAGGPSFCRRCETLSLLRSTLLSRKPRFHPPALYVNVKMKPLRALHDDDRDATEEVLEKRRLAQILDDEAFGLTSSEKRAFLDAYVER